MKIHEGTDRQSRQPKAGEQLSLVNRQQPLDSFKLDDEMLNDSIHSVPTFQVQSL